MKKIIIAPASNLGILLSLKSYFGIPRNVPEIALRFSTGWVPGQRRQTIIVLASDLVGSEHVESENWTTLHFCSILGENYHYGTPVNPAAPSRVPGGSSSGSAVAVAANLVDISLGENSWQLHHNSHNNTQLTEILEMWQVIWSCFMFVTNLRWIEVCVKVLPLQD
jgi:hypothetical protein